MRRWIGSFPQGVPLLFINIVLMYMGFYALIPFLTHHLTHDLLWTSGLAGLLLTVRQLSQQGLTIFTGMIADRIGYKWMLAGGMLLRGIGFALFGFVSSHAGFFLAAVLTGLGGAIFEPTRDAALTALTPEPDLKRMIAVKKVVGNLGIALSAVLSAVLLQFDFRWMSLVSGGIFLFTALLTYVRMPQVHVQIVPVPFQTMGRTILRDHFFIKYVGVLCGYYFMYMQFFLTIPLRAVQITGRTEAISLINLLIAVLIIAGQVPVSRLMARWSLLQGIKLGLLSMGAGLVLLGTVPSQTVFWLGFLLFALGVMIVEPTNMEFTAQIAKPELRATYFGVAALALAVGGGTGQGVGGYLLEAGTHMGLAGLIWWVGGMVAVVAVLALIRLERQEKGGMLQYE